MSSLKRFFITGTGTDVGKTWVTAGIAACCIDGGLRTAVIKPVQTGVPEYPADIDIISELVPGLLQLPQEISMPYCFKLPASPHLAAAEENTIIEPQHIINACMRAQDFDLDVLLLEGAGGLKVPLQENYLTQDLIRELAFPVIVTALAGLGTINHTLLTISALQNEKIDIAGIIINKMPSEPGSVEQNNVEIIEKLAQVPVIGVIRELSTPDGLLAEFKEQTKLKKILFD